MPRHPGTARREPSRPGTALRNQSDSVRRNRNLIDIVAAQQFGQVRWGQLEEQGLAKATIARAVAAGRLRETFPSVYSVMPLALMGDEAWLAAAILAGGDGACLCAHTAAWWAGLLTRRPAAIDVAINCSLREVRGIRWHRLRLDGEERPRLRGLPITPLDRIPLDLAPSMTQFELQGVLAELEFHHGIGPEAVAAIPRRGYCGGAKLGRALAAHTPALAETREGLERVFAGYLMDRDFLLPRFNYPVGKSTVDAVYLDQRIIIELDGVKGHSGERRVLRDHRRDLHRRADGFLPLRYHYAQIINPVDQDLIEAELDRCDVPRNRVVLVPPFGNRVG